MILAIYRQFFYVHNGDFFYNIELRMYLFKHTHDYLFNVIINLMGEQSAINSNMSNLLKMTDLFLMKIKQQTKETIQ